MEDFSKYGLRQGGFSPFAEISHRIQFEFKMKSVQYVSGNFSNNVTLEWLEMSWCESVVHHPLDPSVTGCLVNAGIPGGV